MGNRPLRPNIIAKEASISVAQVKKILREEKERKEKEARRNESNDHT
jgi:hypothetical protein